MEGLSTRGRYAVRILLRLAMNQGHDPMHIHEIARLEEIPPNYVEQLLIRLKGEVW